MVIDDINIVFIINVSIVLFLILVLVFDNNDKKK